MSKTIAYIRVSTDNQDYQNQKFEILNYCDQAGMTVDKWLEVEMSSRRPAIDRRIDELSNSKFSGTLKKMETIDSISDNPMMDEKIYL